MIDKSAESSLTISIPTWLHRATLDILGESTSFPLPLPFILFIRIQFLLVTSSILWLMTAMR